MCRARALYTIYVTLVCFRRRFQPFRRAQFDRLTLFGNKTEFQSSVMLSADHIPGYGIYIPAYIRIAISNVRQKTGICSVTRMIQALHSCQALFSFDIISDLTSQEVQDASFSPQSRNEHPFSLPGSNCNLKHKRLYFASGQFRSLAIRSVTIISKHFFFFRFLFSPF